MKTAIRNRTVVSPTAPTFARTGSGKWHVVGPDGCRYGRAFVDDASPDETVTATDIVAHEPPPTLEDVRSGSRSIDDALSPGGHTSDQRLVLPSAIEESDSDRCVSCRTRLESHQKRRSAVIADRTRVTTVRDAGWDRSERETRRGCDWCRAQERTTRHSDALGTTVCPACGRSFETQLGEPEHTPDEHHLPETPDEPVTPIVFGTTLPGTEYDPTDLVGSNRPLIKCRERHTYADVVFELERTGHGFSVDGIAALEDVRADYADRLADDDTHETDGRLDSGSTPRTVTLEGILPADHEDVIDACWDVVSDPAYWFPLGWPQQGYVHRRSADPAVPGDDPVVEEFPRLRTRQPSSAVDTETLRSITDPGRYDRGERYYERGAVTDVERVDDRLEATVQGSRRTTSRSHSRTAATSKGDAVAPTTQFPASTSSRPCWRVGTSRRPAVTGHSRTPSSRRPRKTSANWSDRSQRRTSRSASAFTTN